MNRVCLKTASWIFVLMTIVSGSVLFAADPPPARDHVVAANQRVTTAPVPPALHRALARPLAVAASFGAKAIPTPPTGSWGIISEGTGGGGIFRDTDSEAEAWLGTNGYGVEGFGSAAGGYFKDSGGTGYAYVGNGGYGILAYGNSAGGYFKDGDGTGDALVGVGDRGIDALGAEVGGIFKDADATGQAYVGFGDRGIEAYGSDMGGFFQDGDDSGYAHVASGHFGIEAYGRAAGAYFKDSDDSGYANVGSGHRGIAAYGAVMGGYFEDTDASGHAEVASGDFGILAYGSEMGGYFKAWGLSGYAQVADGDRGITAVGTEKGGFFSGDEMGGYFADRDESGYAHVAYGHFGIEAYGEGLGGYFEDLNSSANATVGGSTYKIGGTGSVNFIQNHPHDPSSVIVYAAPEGDEVATYTRGTARLVDGEATVPLGETFQWVTNPDIGLTAHLTPRGEPIPLAVVDLSTEEMVVRAPGDAPDDVAFDYIVYGFRIGFEETSVVQEKEMEAYIPSMADHRKLYDRRSDLRKYNSLERFKAMRLAAGEKKALDLSRAHALRDAIIEFDPAVHELPRPPGHERTPADHLVSEENHRGAARAHERVKATRADRDRRLAPGHSGRSAEIPVDDEGNVYATSFLPSSRSVVDLVDVSEVVEPGDVLVIDTDSAGMMRRGFEGHDTRVVGVVTANAGIPLGSQSPMLADGETTAETALYAEVAMAGIVNCKVDAGYGAIWPGDLLVTSPTPGHAMRTDSPLPGTMVGKALESLGEGTGTIQVLVMLR